MLPTLAYLIRRPGRQRVALVMQPGNVGNGGAPMYKRAGYPKHWAALALTCKELAGWRCQHCHCPQGQRRKSRHSGKWYRVRLAAAHLDHDPGNDWPRLAALCERCHGRYDWAWRVRCQAVDVERLKHKMLLKKRQKTRKF